MKYALVLYPHRILKFASLRFIRTQSDFAGTRPLRSAGSAQPPPTPFAAMSNGMSNGIVRFMPHPPQQPPPLLLMVEAAMEETAAAAVALVQAEATLALLEHVGANYGPDDDAAHEAYYDMIAGRATDAVSAFIALSKAAAKARTRAFLCTAVVEAASKAVAKAKATSRSKGTRSKGTSEGKGKPKGTHNGKDGAAPY